MNYTTEGSEMLQEGKYDRTVQLQCPTCGGTDFASIENAQVPELLKCTRCGREISRENLVSENGAHIQAHVDEVKAEVVADIKKEIANIFKGSGFKLK
ncbi:hypothetical protein [Cupriavidus sp.]|jgi:uncharacterized Zn finger protein|uniref:ECs_2282 family putative zinc-binding protein n=1 Tax=Cupriavidus sp. TaxID=1873897 RepID=UPI0025BF08F9|nr:hypothetical protein [Cupriavidus sp.]